jgi:hypothetical protein
MHPISRTVKLAVLLLIASGAAACQRAAALEEMPAGTDVTIEMQDGRRVSGALVSVDPETVVVTGKQNDGRVWVTRTNIAEVKEAPTGAAAAAAPRVVTVPAGSRLEVTLETAVASNTNSVEDPVRATLIAPLVVDGVTVAPRGSVLLGAITGVRESGRVRGRAELGMRFNRLQTEAVTYDIRTAPLQWTAEGTKGEDAAKIGIGAAAGAVIGGIAGGGKGAAVGSAIGAGGGSAVVLATRGEEIHLGAGTTLRVALTEPLAVTAPADDED